MYLYRFERLHARDAKAELNQQNFHFQRTDNVNTTNGLTLWHCCNNVLPVMIMIKLCPLTNLCMGNIFLKNLLCFEGLDDKSRPFIIQQTTAINQKPFMINFCYFNLLRIGAETMKNSKHHLVKLKDCIIFSFYQNNKRVFN